MATLLFPAVIALAGLFSRGRWQVHRHRLIREVAYARAQMRWAQMCTEQVEMAHPSRHVPHGRIARDDARRKCSDLLGESAHL